MDDTCLLFVYGTLKWHPKNGFHDLLGGKAVLVNDKAVMEDSALVSLGGFPGLVYCLNQEVVGEVYRINTAQLEGLDKYEGVPGLYVRVMRMTKCGLRVFMYRYNRAYDMGETTLIIKDGIWNVNGPQAQVPLSAVRRSANNVVQLPRCTIPSPANDHSETLRAPKEEIPAPTGYVERAEYWNLNRHIIPNWKVS